LATHAAGGAYPARKHHEQLTWDPSLSLSTSPETYLVVGLLNVAYNLKECSLGLEDAHPTWTFLARPINPTLLRFSGPPWPQSCGYDLIKMISFKEIKQNCMY
jgi:hypothetical protein